MVECKQNLDSLVSRKYSQKSSCNNHFCLSIMYFQCFIYLLYRILKANSLDFVGKNAFGALFTDEFSVGEL